MPKQAKAGPTSDHLSARVKDFMEAPPVVVDQDVTIDEAAEVMWEGHIGSVIVVDEGKMVGILTASDIIFAVTKSLIGRGVPVSSIMSKTSIMATPNESVLTAIERMMKENVRHLPVVEKDGTPLGIISTRDTMSITEPLLRFVFRPQRKTKAASTTKKKSRRKAATK